MKAQKKNSSLQPRTAAIVLLFIAAALFIIEFFVARSYIESNPQHFSLQAWSFTFENFFLVLLAAVFCIAGAVIRHRKLSLCLIVLSIVAALMQFFAIKITDVFPYFMTYEFSALWPLYLGGLFLLGGAVLRLISKGENGK